MSSSLHEEYYELLWRAVKFGLSELRPGCVDAKTLEEECAKSRGYRSFAEMPLYTRLLCASSAVVAELMCDYFSAIADYVASNGLDRDGLCQELREADLLLANISSTLAEEAAEYKIHDSVYEAFQNAVGNIRGLSKLLCSDSHN
ncbi:hypothetical protein [Acidilobus sp.]|uniref:hypothetical protein n=1 Tax=Acidilobus sp. TaxID=1872109 RepID=UPI003D0567B7